LYDDEAQVTWLQQLCCQCGWHQTQHCSLSQAAQFEAIA
jgi:hypothetical protein